MEDNSLNKYALENLSRLAKPTLPALPEEMISKKPIQVGKCPAKAKLLMFLAALPVSFVTGVVAHFIGIVVAFLGYQLCRLLLAMFDNPGTIDGSFICWIVVIVTLLGYPFLVGVLNHRLIALLGEKAHCRKQKTIAWAGLLNGIPLYLGHVLMSLLIANQLVIMTFTSTQMEPVFPELAGMISEGGPFVYFLCVVEFIILMVGSFLGGHEKQSEESIYCEEHQVWYGEMLEGRYPASMIEKIEQRLINGVPLRPSEQVEFFTWPHFDIGFRRCSVGEDCDVEIRAEAWWLEKSMNSEGKFVDHMTNEVWFDAMFPADLAIAMIEELDLKPQNKKKKK